jgi:hypothetical protein
MKKMLLALFVGALLVGTSKADYIETTSVYKMTSSGGGYVGYVKTGLPKTAYVIADNCGNGYIIWYWAQDGHLYMSEPLCVWAGEQNETGPNDELFYWETALHRDAMYYGKSKTQIADLGYNQSSYGSLEMVGAGDGEGGFPVSLFGSYYSEVVEGDYYAPKTNIGSYDEYMGFGIGTCSARLFKTYMETSAYDMASYYSMYLASKGYSVPEDGSAIYQDY